MIVRDNQNTIRPCIESIRPWVDEMIVVDTGSSDETRMIVESYGAKLGYFDWIDDFSAARNKSLELASGEWIFWMDSDDTITPECGKKLRDLADSEHAEATMAYVMQVRCPSNGDSGCSEFTVVDHVKMFRNREDLRFEGRIHEQVLMPIRRIGGEVVWTDIYVEHSGSEHSLESRRRKNERDLRILRKDLEERPDHPFILFNFAMTYAEIGEFGEALAWLERCLDVSSPEESHVSKALAYQVNCLFQLGRIDDALNTSEMARQLYPDDVELLFREAIALHAMNRYETAIERYRRILDLKPCNGFRSTDPGIQGFKCRFNLGLVYQDANNLEQAELQLRRVLDEIPSYKPAINALGSLLVSAGRFSTASVEAERWSEGLETRIEGLLLLAKVQESLGHYELAAKQLAQCQQEFPESVLVLEECCRYHFIHGNWRKSEHFLNALVELDPENAAALHNLGSVKLANDQPHAAVDLLKRSLKLRPDSQATLGLLRSAQLSAESNSHV